MGATSATGIGLGSAEKITATKLETFANGPSIIFAGMMQTLDSISSPPSNTNRVTFPYPLPGGVDKYVVMLTGINTSSVYVAVRYEDDDGNFTGFSAVSDTDGDAMYMVVKAGFRVLSNQ